ncbi:hypothetical protein P153DRAFT_320582 [Dothidotthia symphoricarpi CBS 119687]|uniref:KOW domain-containing protein n=1 Tax=Dothidotthia symphoricarpi CBS 119687 TaxID=1392245 RepID=A0A6A6A5N0_9PLEO|nr:uncharacterized protein P153DRAFT_320582 [Dothidotthia symphoricarpi CBS 119687]KAF2127120.1 hypothetical protein P153DRAFT_320582 [Dothidotthia symphoricarpi CBS 119687]
MTQLIARPGRNATRQAKKLKEIRKVKGAILWHEKARKERQKIQQERWESKQSARQHVVWNNEYVKGTKKEALANAYEDWRLGPLRPNRATGRDADKYGALTGGHMQKPDIPVRVQKNRNESRIRQGLDSNYPLVVDDKKYFPIVRDDRVLMMTGRDKGKIGQVAEVIGRTHEAIIKEMNMQYYDADVFSNADGHVGPRRESEVPIHLDNLRLVVPYEINNVEKRQKVYKDVIVDKLFMERHTTGMDPFTATDYGDATIPEEHQYDPSSGLPIFHRYIAGTRHRIEWPWEKEEQIEDRGITVEDKLDGQTWVRKTLNTLRHPITSLNRWRDRSKNVDAVATREEVPLAAQLEEIESRQLARIKNDRPRSWDPKDPDAYEDVDTTRNIVDSADSMSYTLIAPPFPQTLGTELRDDIREFVTKAGKASKEGKDGSGAIRRPKSTTEHQIRAKELLKEQRRAAERMKTPMQLRWELDHAKKIKEKKENPMVDTETLLLALGQHMEKSGVKVKRRADSDAAELD